jgi:hypothetical protein
VFSLKSLQLILLQAFLKNNATQNHHQQATKSKVLDNYLFK